MHIDLNADVGEGFEDAQLFPWLSSVNISCGAHAGDKQTLKRALELCQEHQVVAGAHPSYPDRANFGRKEMQLSPSALKSSLRQQLDFFFELASNYKGVVGHVKAHGALYNQAARDLRIGEILLEVVADYQLPLMTLAQSPLFEVAKQQAYPVLAEAFADRAYDSEGSLRSRNHADALLDIPQAIAQSLNIIQHQLVKTIGGNLLPIRADSLCIHGDHPNAGALLTQLHQQLRQQNVALKHPFSSCRSHHDD